MYIRDYYVPEDPRIEKMNWRELEETISSYKTKKQLNYPITPEETRAYDLAKDRLNYLGSLSHT